MILDVERVRRARELRGHTRRSTASVAGISESAWCKMERGYIISPHTAAAIAQTLGVEISDLYPTEKGRALEKA